MGKAFGFIKNILGFIGIVLILNLLVNWLILWENNGSKYTDKYMQESIEVKINVKEIADWFYYDEKISMERYKELMHKAYENNNKEITEALETDFGTGYNSYVKYSIFYKGIMGSSDNYTIQDGKTGRYYMIMRFDEYGWLGNTQPQSSKLPGEDLYMTVDSVQYNNQTYGTREKPIVVLKYRGVNGQISFTASSKEKGDYMKVLEPTEEEYRYNVENYLTYVMTSKEFDQRFHTERSITYYLLWGLGIVVVLGGAGWLYSRRIKKDNNKQDARITDYLRDKNRRG